MIRKCDHENYKKFSLKKFNPNIGLITATLLYLRTINTMH